MKSKESKVKKPEVKKYDFNKGDLVKLSPDKASEHGIKLRLVDMKKSLYRVMESFNDPKKVSLARKNADKL